MLNKTIHRLLMYSWNIFGESILLKRKINRKIGVLIQTYLLSYKQFKFASEIENGYVIITIFVYQLFRFALYNRNYKRYFVNII